MTETLQLATDALRIEGLGKVFPGVKALDGVSFTVVPGQVRGLLGENGAGKSTLLKILGGQYRPDSGRVFLGERECHFQSADQAIAAGIAVIHQELQSVPDLTVAENVLLGRLPSRFGVIRRRAVLDEVQQKLDALGVTLDPGARMGELSIAQRQMVEIAKAVTRGARVICFDEPTSSLSHFESEILFRIVRDLRRAGCMLIYISHRLDELYELCDACTILRDGRSVASHPDMQAVPRSRLIADMVGREVADIYSYRPRRHGPSRLEVSGLHGPGVRAPTQLAVAGGEVLGLFGLVGAGRSELMRLIFGAVPAEGGSVAVDGVAVRGGHPSYAIAQGIAMCPEDRKGQGIFPQASVAENINISSRRHHLRAGLVLDRAFETRQADEFIAALRIKTPHRDQRISLLSGGNQQKAILARWLAEPGLKVLILDEPTRGIDVGAKSEIYRIVHDVAERGCAVIVVSSELPEITGICDRVIVMCGGRISGELPRDALSEKELLRMALPDAATATP